jgi:hypothetical protein
MVVLSFMIHAPSFQNIMFPCQCNDVSFNGVLSRMGINFQPEQVLPSSSGQTEASANELPIATPSIVN